MSRPRRRSLRPAADGLLAHRIRGRRHYRPLRPSNRLAPRATAVHHTNALNPRESRNSRYSYGKNGARGPDRLCSATHRVTCPRRGATRLVFASPERRLDTKVTRRFCESASCTATAGPPTTATTRTASSAALESRSTVVAGKCHTGAPAGTRRFACSHVTGRVAGLAATRSVPQVAHANGTQRLARHPTSTASMQSPTATPVGRLKPFDPPP
jgi:hypothetical protein